MKVDKNNNTKSIDKSSSRLPIKNNPATPKTNKMATNTGNIRSNSSGKPNTTKSAAGSLNLQTNPSISAKSAKKSQTPSKNNTINASKITKSNYNADLPNDSITKIKNPSIDLKGEDNVLEAIEKAKKVENQRMRILEQRIKKYGGLHFEDNQIGYEP